MRTPRRLTFAAPALVLVFSAGDAAADPQTHDGFYLQLAAGLGYLSSSASNAGAEVSMSGVTIPSTFLLGGTPFKGFVIGGGVLTDYSFSPKYKVSFNGQEMTGTSGITSQYLFAIGPFVDYYVNPNEGLHFQGMFGWGGLESSFSGNVGGSDPTGMVIALGGGYDFWVSSEWSIGVLGRFTYAPLSLNGQGYTTIAPALLATFTYH